MIRVSTRLVAMAAGTLLVAAFSFRPSLAQAPPGNTVALTGARVIDGTGRAAVEKGTVVIRDGLLEAVGPVTSVKIPAGTTRIDVSGKTIIPGLIDSHAHLNVEQGSTIPVRDDLVRRLRMYAMYGVTSAVSLGSTPSDEMEGLKLRDEQSGAQTRATLDRARLYTGALNAIGKTPEEARKSVDRLADLKADIIKYHINGTPNDMTPDMYGAIVDEAQGCAGRARQRVRHPGA